MILNCVGLYRKRAVRIPVIQHCSLLNFYRKNTISVFLVLQLINISEESTIWWVFSRKKKLRKKRKEKKRDKGHCEKQFTFSIVGLVKFPLFHMICFKPKLFIPFGMSLSVQPT